MQTRFFSSAVLLTIFSLQPSRTTAGKIPKSPAEVIPVGKRVLAPQFSLTDVQGGTLSLGALRGRVVLLNFWAISCGGCKLELPLYVEFDHRFASKGLSLVGLDMYGETPEAVKNFAATEKMRYPLAIGTDEIGAAYQLGAMPLTVLIDRKARIAVSHTGVVDPKLFEADIRALLAE